MNQVVEHVGTKSKSQIYNHVKVFEKNNLSC